MRKIVDTNSEPGRIVLISGDCDFSADLHGFRYRKGYEIVLFHNKQAKEALIQCANHSMKFESLQKNENKIKDKKIQENSKTGKGAQSTKIKNDPDMSKDEQKKNNLYVGNLGTNVDESTFNEHFAKYGKIISTKIVGTKGFGFVCFSNAKEAAKALADSHIINERRLEVSIYKKKEGNPAKIENVDEEKKNKLYIGNLDSNVDNTMLKQSFAKYGKISSANVMKNKGCGFVTFQTPQDASKALADNQILCGRKLKVKLYSKKKESKPQKATIDEQRNKLFVGNLDSSVEEEALRKYFAKYGKITSANIVSNHGIGFVEFSNPKDASEALAENMSILNGKQLNVSIFKKKDKTESKSSNAEKSKVSKADKNDYKLCGKPDKKEIYPLVNDLVKNIQHVEASVPVAAKKVASKLHVETADEFLESFVIEILEKDKKIREFGGMLISFLLKKECFKPEAVALKVSCKNIIRLDRSKQGQ